MPKPKQNPLNLKRGAPKGNRNALKHGFYARIYSTQERRDLGVHHFSGAWDEIILLRIALRRLVATAVPPDANFSEITAHYRAIGLLSVGLSRLMGVQMYVGNPEHDRLLETLATSFDQAIEEMENEGVPPTRLNINRNAVPVKYLDSDLDANLDDDNLDAPYPPLP
jgi:hypothetical protein